MTGPAEREHDFSDDEVVESTEVGLDARAAHLAEFINSTYDKLKAALPDTPDTPTSSLPEELGQEALEEAFDLETFQSMRKQDLPTSPRQLPDGSTVTLQKKALGFVIDVSRSTPNTENFKITYTRKTFTGLTEEEIALDHHTGDIPPKRRNATFSLNTTTKYGTSYKLEITSPRAAGQLSVDSKGNYSVDLRLSHRSRR